MVNTTELLFLTVPPPRSGNVVDYLVDYPEVLEAAAVYTETDVIAQVCEQSEHLGRFISEKVAAFGHPIEHVERYPVDSVLEGPNSRKGRYQGHSSVFAFVRCFINLESTNFQFAVQRLSNIDGVRFVYPNVERAEVVVQIMAPDKVAFDEAVMSRVQDRAGMLSRTRTYITINDMHWSETGIPRSRYEYKNAQRHYPIFMGVAEEDIGFGLSLCEQIARDTQVRVWNYRLIKPGARSWTSEVDKAVSAATAYLFIITDHFLKSHECQREFGKIEAIANPESICCLVLPPANIFDLPIRYQSRQCIDGTKFFAYSELLRWLYDVV